MVVWVFIVKWSSNEVNDWVYQQGMLESLFVQNKGNYLYFASCSVGKYPANAQCVLHFQEGAASVGEVDNSKPHSRMVENLGV